ncbi:MOG interacting and ectopic P-granules protein 1-like [Mizuhopecten yessoensis]|uniref:MOG interacting and ectopic P-granules protein 1 n=1 Tax=Mizuhopecten yessoensis TaxID=6573 RepID=A0A210R2C1_MIZYE|nr:MOG interacting and ectopic P-granules protein 1-like [Mizuhopecten yessoensis]XP_021372199.1 MOG interacting and ectopic P-granules protein 1-like [Mizuhopecten yessoensis]OWF55230.1 MOG interacting and ectopic P-granules protein 1 [Mizuhopecten yessoensis]
MMSAEASGIESVAVNGNMEEGPDHADGKIEDPDNHRINSIKKFKEAMSQNGSSENADMPDACNRTATVDDRICDNSKEKTVKENGLNTNSVCSDEVNDKHTEVTKCGKSDDLPAVDPMENVDESKIKEDEMEVDESKSDSNVNESPMETDSNDTKCEAEECPQADNFNNQEIAKQTSEESVQNNKGDESNKENNIAQEAKEESSVEMISSTEQKASKDEQNSLKSENVAQDSKPSSNNDTKSSENDKSEDKSEKSGFDINMTNCNSEIFDESKKKEVKDSSKEEASIAKESSKEEGPKEKDISKEEDSQVKKQGNSEEEQSKKDAKSIDTLTDEDGSEFIITINEDDSGSEKEEEVVKDKAITQPRPEVPPPVRAPVKASIPNILQKSDAKISVSLQSSKSLQQQQYILPNASPNQVVSKTQSKSAQGGKVQYYPIHLQTTTGTSQYMQSVMVAGKSVLVPVSSSGIAGTSTQYLIDPKKSIMSKKPIMTASLNAKAKTFTSPPVTPVKQGSGQKQETYSVQKGIETIERDADLPLASWEMIDLVKWEIASHKPDNTFWMGLCNVNKKAELSAPSKFLFDLGSDIVKESAYKQITHVQTKKKEAGKLNDVEKENLEKMKKVVKELEDKLSHMAMKKHKCSCGFQTESENVMNFHKEHPHMQPPLNPQGSMTCAHCNFETNDGTKYSFHMESEHNKVGRVYSKPAFWQCGLCYYEHNSKNKLTNHKWKCMKHFKANQNQAPHHTDINYCLKNIYYKYQIKKPPPPPKPPAAKVAQQHNHNTRHIIKPPTSIQPRLAQGPLLANQLQQNNFTRPSIRAATQIPGVVYSNQAAALASRQQKNPPRFPQNNQPVRNPMQVVVRPPATYKGNTTVNQLLMRAKGPNQPQKPPQKPPQSIAKKTVSQPAKQTAGPTFEVCEICGGYVKDRMSLRIHFFYAHKIDIPQHVFNRDVAPLLCEVCKSRFWTTQGLSKHRLATQHSAAAPKQPSVTITGDNTCWICHQRQANLYTHLLQFHRLSTGECMMLKRCMFCGSLSTNRKDLEIHMAAAHGVLIKGANNPPSTPARPPPVKQPAPKTVVVGPKTSVTTTGGKGSGLVRNNFCVFCCKQFADNTQLTLHCLGTHATCSSCGMVVAQNSDLKTHVCRSGSVRNCPMCGVKNLKPNAYTRHISLFHLKKCVVRLKRMSQKQIKEATRKKEPLLPVAGTVVIDLRPPEDRKRSASEDDDGDIYVPGIKRMKPDEETEELSRDKMTDDAKVQVEKKYNDQADEEMKDEAGEQVKVQKESTEQAAKETTDEASEQVKVLKESNDETPEEMKDEAGEQVKVQKESNEQAAEKTTNEASEQVKVQKESNDETTEEMKDEAAEQVKVQKESTEQANEQSKDEVNAPVEEIEKVSQTKDDGNGDNVAPQ